MLYFGASFPTSNGDEYAPGPGFASVSPARLSFGAMVIFGPFPFSLS